MQIIAALGFAMMLVGSLGLIAAMLWREKARIAAVLAGAELTRARTVLPARISAAGRRPYPARPARRPLRAAAA